MTKQEQQQLREYWHEHITACQASNLSGANYCKEHNLIYHRFVYWRQKFSSSSQSASPVKTGGFVRLAPGSTAVDGLTLALPNGLEVRGISHANVDLISRLMSTLS